MRLRKRGGGRKGGTEQEEGTRLGGWGGRGGGRAWPAQAALRPPKPHVCRRLPPRGSPLAAHLKKKEMVIRRSPPARTKSDSFR